MRVLVIGYVWPEPKSSAAGSRMLALLRLFRNEGWAVTFASPAAASDHAVDLSEWSIESVAITLNCSSFDEFATELQPDIVLFDRFMMEEQFGWRVENACPKAIRILDTEDLHCLRDARHMAVKQQRDFCVDDLNSDIAKREVAAIWRCDVSLMISQYEMQLLQQHFKVDASLLHYCPFMLDVQNLDQAAPSFSERQHFVSIGNFRHAPNWDSVLWLSREIWPLVRQQLPTAELHIYGAYPPKKATDLHNLKKGFHVLGWADDALEVMKSARVCLAPLRFGAGIKGKFADAMMCGTPSVTTSVGAESMYLTDDGDEVWAGEVADSAQAIADAAVELYQNESLWLQAQSIGEKIIRRHYCERRIGRELLQRLSLISEKLDQHRCNNFIGAMLRHHSHRSTKFMSQWIEVKGKLESIS